MKDMNILYYSFILGDCISTLNNNSYSIEYKFDYDNTITKGLIKYDIFCGKIIYGKDTAKWFIETLLKHKKNN